MQCSSAFQTQTEAMEKLKGLKCNGDAEGPRKCILKWKEKETTTWQRMEGKSHSVKGDTGQSWSEEREQTDDQEKDTF